MKISYRWSHIEDLPEDHPALHNTEISALAKVWAEQKESLHQDGLVDPFVEKLVRELAIEGGIIERAYTLDRGVTLLLIEQGVQASLIPSAATNKDPQLVASLIHAHQAAVEQVFDLVKQNRRLSTAVIKELHATLMQHQSTTTANDPAGNLVEVPLLKGAYKQHANNPLRPDGSIHEYCPPEHVDSEMDRLLVLHEEHRTSRVPPDVEAAWLHHRFTKIHPFQDGNGRIARLLATWAFIRDGCFPLVLKDEEHRSKYISALEIADRGDLSSLVSLFAAVQRSTFVKALGIAREVQQDEALDHIIKAAAADLGKRLDQKLEHLRTLSSNLHRLACERFEDVAVKLREQMQAVHGNAQFHVDADSNQGARRHYHKFQIVNVARQLDYFANIGLHHDWVRLVLKIDQQAEILLSLHGVGPEYRGILAVTVAFFHRTHAEQLTPAIAAVDSAFLISDQDSLESAEQRFLPWLNEALVRALAIWRREL